MSAPITRYRIIGQGLAGSVLGLLLMERGVDVEIFDDGHQSSSSVIAAGMWNPISFRKLILSWEADQFIPVMEEVYPRFEKKLGVSFYHRMPLVRLFGDFGSGNDWDHRSTHPEVGPFLSAAQDPDIPSHFEQPYGHGMVNNCGWMDMKVFLEAARTHFEEAGMLRIQSFNALPEDDPQTMHIYCTGWKSPFDPHFEKIPLAPNKGQVLTFEADLPISSMVNFGNFIVPLGNNSFRLGATYELEPEHIHPTPEGKKELEDSLHAVTKSGFRTKEHHAGYRPTTPDRKPVLGTHPQHPNLAIFNGLGSRGVLQAPRMAQELIAHLLEGAPIRREISLMRFYRKK